MLVVEDGGPFVGSLCVPALLREVIETSPKVRVAATFDERVARLTQVYGDHAPRDLARAPQRIRRRLGGAVSDRAVSLLFAGRPEAAIAVLLTHFDDAYRHRWSALSRTVVGEVHAS